MIQRQLESFSIIIAAALSPVCNKTLERRLCLLSMDIQSGNLYFTSAGALVANLADPHNSNSLHHHATTTQRFALRGEAKVLIVLRRLHSINLLASLHNALFHLCCWHHHCRMRRRALAAHCSDVIFTIIQGHTGRRKNTS